MGNINVCLSCDDNYAKYAGVVITSALANSAPEDKLTFYVLDGGITEENKEKILSIKSLKDCEINIVKIDESLFEQYKQIKTHSYVTTATYYRLKLPSLLPNVERIIYLDCDVIVNSSLKEFFETELNNSLVAGAQDLNERMIKKNPNYVNAGVLLFNLKQMREENIEDKFLTWTTDNIENIKVGDQTIINEVCKDRIKLIDAGWNVQSSNFTNRSSYTNEPKIIHFVSSKKPWHWASFSYHRNLYFKNLQLSPWKLDEKEYKHWTKDNQIASLIAYVKYRPFFLFRPRFYNALYQTYLKPTRK